MSSPESDASPNIQTSTEEPAPKIVEEPVFLVGAERSGTTLLLLLLDHHPGLCFPGEFDFTIKLMPEGKPPELEAYYESLKTDRIFLFHDLEIDRELNFEELVNSFLLQEQARSSKPRVGASIHFNYGNILKVWPRAKLIHLVRDPRDVASSCIQMGWAGNVWCAIEKWIRSESEWDAMVDSVPPEQLLELRFEDLVRDVEGSLTRICEFIGLDYSPDMLRFHEDTTYDPIDPGIAQKWRGKLDDTQVRLIESRVGPLLEKKGYERSGLPPLKVGKLRELTLRAQSAWWTRRFRVRRYGWRLCLLRPLAKLLGNQDWVDRLELEFNEIQNRLIK